MPIRRPTYAYLQTCYASETEKVLVTYSERIYIRGRLYRRVGSLKQCCHRTLVEDEGEWANLRFSLLPREYYVGIIVGLTQLAYSDPSPRE